MSKALKKCAASFNDLGREETEASEMSNKVVRKHNVEGETSDQVERNPKGWLMEKRKVVVQNVAKARKTVVMNNSAGNWSGSSTEEESEDENLATVEKNLSRVRAKLLSLQAGKLDNIHEPNTEKQEEWSSQSGEEEFFGINQEGKFFPLNHTLSKEPAPSSPGLNCHVVEESATEEESEGECDGGEECFAPQNGKFGCQRGQNSLRLPHTPRQGKREGRGRGKQVPFSFLCSFFQLLGILNL